MASTSPAIGKMCLKLVIDTKGSRVLLVEAGKDFIDFLFDIFSLPSGAIMSLLQNKSMVGCLGNLYKSIEDLSENCMLPDVRKDGVLIPKALASLSWPKIVSLPTTYLYKCGGCSARSHGVTYVTDNPLTMCPSDGITMNSQLTYVVPPVAKRGYVKEMTYMVTDDLVVQPMSTISTVTLLNRFKAKDADFIEEKMVTLSADEGLKLIKASLQSEKVFTEVFLGKEA